MTGPQATNNPFRFSTKYADDESDIVMYPKRPYSPLLGRWLSRDPIDENGGLNLYGFVGNAPVNKVDSLGLFVADPNPIAVYIVGPPPPSPNGGPGYHSIPDWFYNPTDEGKPCCCSPAATVKKFVRTDPSPTRGLLRFSIDLELSGCYKDLAIVWWTCTRPDGSGGWMPGFDNQKSAYLTGVDGITLPFIGDISTGAHVTQTHIRYLSCEGKKWVKHTDMVGRAYMWQNGQWIWN